MSSVLPIRRSFSATAIDRACRDGLDVRLGQFRICAAQTHVRVDGRVQQAARGFVWVDVLPDHEWRQVRASDVSVPETLKGASNVSTEAVNINQRRGRRKNLGSGPEPTDDTTLVDEEHDGQKRLDGMERVADPDIEDKAWSVKSQQDKRMKAGEKEKELRQELTDMMVAKSVDNYPLDDEYEVVLKKSAKAYVRKRRKTEPDDE